MKFSPDDSPEPYDIGDPPCLADTHEMRDVPDDHGLPSQFSTPNIADFLSLFAQNDSLLTRSMTNILQRLLGLLRDYPDVAPLWCRAWQQLQLSEAKADEELFVDLTRDGLWNLGTWICASRLHFGALLSNLDRMSLSLESTFSHTHRVRDYKLLIPFIRVLRTILRVRKFQLSCQEILTGREVILRRRENIGPTESIQILSRYYPNYSYITPEQFRAYMQGQRTPEIFDIGMRA